MLFSRRIVLGLPLAILAAPRAACAAEPGAAPAALPTALIERFYGVLLAVMKDAKRLSFDERYNRLAPAIAQTFDLAVGSPGTELEFAL